MKKLLLKLPFIRKINFIKNYIISSLQTLDAKVSQISDENMQLRRKYDELLALSANMDLKLSLHSLQLDSINSCCMNELIKNQQGIEYSDRYKYYYKLHNILRCKNVTNAELKRIGREHDGGYVMADPFSRARIAYSFGISDDVSWDLEMAKRGYDIFQYDHTIEELPVENKAFHWSKTGVTGGEETEQLKNLKTLLKENGHENQTGMLLKMDVEGYEWDVFNSCEDELLDRFDQIVLELHWLNDLKRQEVIINALSKLIKNHSVAHVHGNNNGHAEFCGNYITPDYLEVLLLKNSVYEIQDSIITLPRNIDEANRTDLPDIYLGNWNS